MRVLADVRADPASRFYDDCFEDNAVFMRARMAGYRIHCLRDPDAEAVLSALLPDPDKLLAQGELFKFGTRTHAGRIVVEGRSYFLKSYKCRGPWYRVRHLLKRSRAMHVWGTSWQFIDRGVSLLTPFVCMEQRWFGLLGRSYFLMEFAEEASTLRALWGSLEPDQKQHVLLEVASQLGTMHAAGCLHGDLKWDNLLMSSRPDGWHLGIVDLDGSRAFDHVSRQQVEKDLGRFLKDLRKYEADSAYETTFMQCWEMCLLQKKAQ